ncbi:MAG: RnfH family protein [Gammaproteobacteria bacterium]
MPDRCLIDAPSVMPSSDLMTVEVVYARPEEQVLIGLRLPMGSTVEDAIRASGLTSLFPEIDPVVDKVGIHGRICPLHQGLKPNDRVEIYRPLQHDPKDARRLRAANKR